MNDKAWYFFYALLFFSILVPTTMCLFLRDNSDPINNRLVAIILNSASKDYVYPIQTFDTDNPDDCMENLLNKLQSGNFDPRTLRDNLDSLEECFQLNLDNSTGNKTPEVPQPPIANSPQFV